MVGAAEGGVRPAGPGCTIRQVSVATGDLTLPTARPAPLFLDAVGPVAEPRGCGNRGIFVSEGGKP